MANQPYAGLTSSEPRGSLRAMIAITCDLCERTDVLANEATATADGWTVAEESTVGVGTGPDAPDLHGICPDCDPDA